MSLFEAFVENEEEPRLAEARESLGNPNLAFERNLQTLLSIAAGKGKDVPVTETALATSSGMGAGLNDSVQKYLREAQEKALQRLNAAEYSFIHVEPLEFEERELTEIQLVELYIGEPLPGRTPKERRDFIDRLRDDPWGLGDFYVKTDKFKNVEQTRARNTEDS